MKIRILVVDDEFHTCELMAEKIRSFAFDEVEEVLCAGSGREALQILEETPCQILITDICMSPMDGLELVSNAKELLPELECILLSAFDEFSYAQRGIRLRIRDYWLKPCSGKRMQKSLSGIIKEYQSNQSRSRTMLDAVINEAVFSGGKTVEDVFRDTPAYPGNGGYLVIWEGEFTGDISIPGFWVCKLLNGKSLFACPAESPSLNDREWLQVLLEQIDRPCGVSLLGGQISELYWQAEYALSLKWVWESRCMIFYDEREYMAEALDRELRETLKQVFTVNPENVQRILAQIGEQQKCKTAFAFGVYVDRIIRGIRRNISELTGEPAREVVPRVEKGWRRPLESVLQEMIAAKSQQMNIRKKDPIRWSVEYVATHFGDENLDMTMLADKLGISYQYFSELFHKQTGKTFSEYILEFRMKEACRLLLQGERVSDVSQKVGYQHVHSFTRAFKRMYGISPNAFRNMKG